MHTAHVCTEKKKKVFTTLLEAPSSNLVAMTEASDRGKRGIGISISISSSSDCVVNRH